MKLKQFRSFLPPSEFETIISRRIIKSKIENAHSKQKYEIVVSLAAQVLTKVIVI